MEDVYSRGLHERSHGESFLDIAVARLRPGGFYIFDESKGTRRAAARTRSLIRRSSAREKLKSCRQPCRRTRPASRAGGSRGGRHGYLILRLSAPRMPVLGW